VVCGVGVLVLPLGLSKLVEAAVAKPKESTAAADKSAVDETSVVHAAVAKAE
jgi:hypothetical protein